MDLLTPHLYKRELTGVPQRIILKMYMVTGDECFLRHVMKIGDPTQSVVQNIPYRNKPLKTGRWCSDCKRDICTKGLPSGAKRTQINGLSKPTTICEKCGLAKCSKMKVCASSVYKNGANKHTVFACFILIAQLSHYKFVIDYVRYIIYYYGITLTSLYHDLTLHTLSTINLIRNYIQFTLVTRTLFNTFISCFTFYILCSLELHSLKGGQVQRAMIQCVYQSVKLNQLHYYAISLQLLKNLNQLLLESNQGKFQAILEAVPSCN